MKHVWIVWDEDYERNVKAVCETEELAEKVLSSLKLKRPNLDLWIEELPLRYEHTR